MTEIIDVYNLLIKYNGSDIDVIIDKNDNIWFSALNIIRALDYKDSKDAIKNQVDKTDKLQYRYIDQLIKLPKKIHPQTLFISESGLYSLVLKSRMIKATQFKKWITHEVIPSLRKYGVYEVSKKEKKEIAKLNKTLKEKNKQIKKLEKNQKKEKYPDGGILYIMKPYSNKNFVKIGMTYDMNARVKSYGTSFPDKPDIVYWVKIMNPAQIEICLKAALYDYLYRNKKEQYKCKLEKVINSINNCIQFIPNSTNKNLSREKTKKIFNKLDQSEEYIVELDFTTNFIDQH
jgi:prophage antirepressor-like protein